MSTVTGHQDDTPASPELSAIADRFVAARRQGAALEGFPGDIPDDLVTAYQVQDLAIAQWPDAVVGCALTVERLMLPPSAEAQVPRPRS